MATNNVRKKLPLAAYAGILAVSNRRGNWFVCSVKREDKKSKIYEPSSGAALSAISNGLRVLFLVIIMQENQSAIMEAMVKIASLRADRITSAAMAIEMENIALRALLQCREHVALKSGTDDSFGAYAIDDDVAEVKRRTVEYLAKKESAYISVIVQMGEKRKKLRPIARATIMDMVKSGEIVPVIGSDGTATKFYRLP